MTQFQYKWLTYLKNFPTSFPFDQSRVKYAVFHYNAAPLLGRDQEVDLYKTLLEQAREYSAPKVQDLIFCNMLIIQGVHRQGKTRMLEELMYVTDSTIPMLRFNLTYAEYEVSTKWTNEIFFNVLVQFTDDYFLRIQ